MNLPTLQELFRDRDERACKDLASARKIVSHPVEKGDLSENIWLDLMRNYLPDRYQVRKAFIIDCQGRFSQQIDIVVHDRFYTPFVFKFGGYEIVPIESVYAVFEVKQEISKRNLRYAAEKVTSVKALIPTLRATVQVPNPIRTPIVTGLLATSIAEKRLRKAENLAEWMLGSASANLNFVCSSSDGLYALNASSTEILHFSNNPISSLVLRLFSDMQANGTVSPINLDDYLSGD